MTSRERDIVKQAYNAWNESAPYTTMIEMKSIIINEAENGWNCWLNYTDIKSFEEIFIKPGWT